MKKQYLAVSMVLAFLVCFSPGVFAQDTTSVVDANNQFAFDLYAKYRSEPGNIFFSPYSISVAIAMAAEGAKGQTLEEMQSVLHLPKDDALRRQGFLGVCDQINKKGKKYKLSTANALWAQKDYVFLPEYLSLVKEYYGGKVTNLDFAKDAEKSRLAINRWVEDQTNDKIKDLIPQGALGPLTRLVLTNAIYFKGDWVIQFDKKNTMEKDFKVMPGKPAKAQMMSLTGEKARFNYAETEDLQVLELPYAGEELSMLILLPREGAMGSLEDSLDMGKIDLLKKSLKEEQVNVYMPKYKFETKYMLAATLKEMGMPAAFSGAADFSGMTGNNELNIDQVIHQAFVEVNEKGTEAAAATALVMKFTSMPIPKEIKIFNADHPFIFIIQEKQTGNILFLGRVSDPTSK